VIIDSDQQWRGAEARALRDQYAVLQVSVLPFSQIISNVDNMAAPHPARDMYLVAFVKLMMPMTPALNTHTHLSQLQADKAVALADAERLAAALQAAQHRLRHMAIAERRRDRELTRCQQAVAVVSATKVMAVNGHQVCLAYEVTSPSRVTFERVFGASWVRTCRNCKFVCAY
jgi:hypothetical protein